MFFRNIHSHPSNWVGAVIIFAVASNRNSLQNHFFANLGTTPIRKFIGKAEEYINELKECHKLPVPFL